MSSYATVYLSDGRAIWSSFRNGVDDLLFMLFTTADRIALDGEDAYRLKGYPDESPSDASVTGFRTSVFALRERLDVTGFDLAAVSTELDLLLAEKIDSRHSWYQSWDNPPDYKALIRSELEALDALDWTMWVAELRDGLRDGEALVEERAPLGSASWLMSLWEDSDLRLALRALLEALPDDETITLDVDDLIKAGYLDPSVDPRSVETEFADYARRGGIPPIVLTEGSFDAEVLTSGLRLRRPHLVDYIRFPDFSFRPERNAAALLQTVRGFASAGIPNRVVAIFDNDAAARDVVRLLDVESLPPNIVIRHLPVLPLAKSYPTLGPQGESHMDVNGLAASIEMFLGVDVLTVDGALRPIEWRGYVAGIKAYQGVVVDKGAIQAGFRAKVIAATRNLDEMAGQDWTGIDLILDSIVVAMSGNS